MTDDVVAANKVVYVTYSIVDQSGAIFEHSDTPIGYVQGENSGLFEKVENALLDHRAGDQIEVSLNPTEGFGDYDPLLTFTDALNNVLPANRYVGAEIEYANKCGESMSFWVRHLDEDKITLDANHPLAGQTVTFIVTITSIRDADPEEIASGLEANVAQACEAAAAQRGLKNLTGNIRGFFSRIWS